MSVLKRFVPLFDRVLIERIKPQTITASGIVLPESSQPSSKLNKGKVLAVGAGARTNSGSFLKPTVKVGDEVILSDSYHTTSVKIDGNDYEIYKEEDIVAILNK